MIIDTNAISTCADGCQKVDVALTAQPLVALLNDLKFGVARQHVEISVGDAGDGLHLDPREGQPQRIRSLILPLAA